LTPKNFVRRLRSFVLLRATVISLALLWLAPAPYAQDAPPPAAAEQRPPNTKKPKKAPAAAQDPYCELGAGPCGGTCNQEDGKSWNCPAAELPCYQRGHCKCEKASICKPKKKPAPPPHEERPSGLFR